MISLSYDFLFKHLKSFCISACFHHIFVCVLLTLSFLHSIIASEKVSFNRDIRPILSNKCFFCHGPSEKSRKANLRLDLEDEALKEKNGFAAFAQKSLDKSEAWQRIKSEDPDEGGKVVQRVPYGNPLDPPKEGNRLLSNLEKIESWMKQVHKIHEEKGMGWVSPYGCPEDGQQAYDNRAKCLEKLSMIVDSINSNFDA